MNKHKKKLKVYICPCCREEIYGNNVGRPLENCNTCGEELIYLKTVEVE